MPAPPRDPTRRRRNADSPPGEQAKVSGADHSVMRELNRTIVLDLLKTRSPISRAAIAKAASLAKPTVSAIVDEFIADGLVREIGVGATTTGGGRPPILLEFNEGSQFVVGVQIGVRRTTIVVADARGDEIRRGQVTTPRGRPAVVLHRVATEIEAVVKASDVPMSRIAAVGVVVPGMTDFRSGVCLLAPNLGWRDVPVRDLLGEVLRAPVFVHNTAEPVAVAEQMEGVGQGVDDLVVLYVGSGLGSGVLAGGRVFHGYGGLAGEIGHCRVPGLSEPCNCGNVGCLETVASGPAISRAAERAVAARRRTRLAPGADGKISPEDVAVAAAEGDVVANEILTQAAEWLGLAGSWLVNLFNPAVLVIGGGLIEVGEPLLRPFVDAVQRNALAPNLGGVDIRVSQLGQDAEVRGAVLLALQQSETYYRVVFQT